MASRYIKTVFSLPANATKRITVKKKLSQAELEAFVAAGNKVTMTGKGQACTRVLTPISK